MSLARTFFGKAFFRENVFAWIALPLVTIFIFAAWVLPVHILAPEHSAQAWSTPFLRTLSVFTAMAFFGSLAWQYRRLMESDLVSVLPDYAHRHEGVMQAALTSGVVFFALSLWQRGALWSGALLLSLLFALMGISYGQGVRISMQRRLRWLRGVLNLMAILLFVHLQSSRGWEELAELPPGQALALSAVVSLMLYGSLRFHPAHWRSEVEAAEGATDKREARRAKGYWLFTVHWPTSLRWMPRGWDGPVAALGFPLGVAGTVLLAFNLILVNMLFNIVITAISHWGHWGAMGATLTDPHPRVGALVMATGFLSLILGLWQSRWAQLMAEWRAVFLTGFAGGRAAFCRQVFREHFRRALLHSLAASFAVSMAAYVPLPHVPPTLLLFLILYCSVAAFFASHMDAFALLLFPNSVPLQGIVRLLTALSVITVLPGIIYAALRDGPSWALAGGAVCLVLLAVLGALYRWGPGRLARLDWVGG